MAADRFGPDIDEAESRWDALCSVRPEYFDGGLLAVGGVTRNGHGGVTLTVAPCPYRWYAVQDDAFDLGLRPLGVRLWYGILKAFCSVVDVQAPCTRTPIAGNFYLEARSSPKRILCKPWCESLRKKRDWCRRLRQWPKHCAMTLWPERGKWCTNFRSNALRGALLILMSTPNVAGLRHHLCRAPWPRSLNVWRIC